MGDTGQIETLLLWLTSATYVLAIVVAAAVPRLRLRIGRRARFALLAVAGLLLEKLALSTRNPFDVFLAALTTLASAAYLSTLVRALLDSASRSRWDRLAVSMWTVVTGVPAFCIAALALGKLLPDEMQDVVGATLLAANLVPALFAAVGLFVALGVSRAARPSYENSPPGSRAPRELRPRRHSRRFAP